MGTLINTGVSGINSGQYTVKASGAPSTSNSGMETIASGVISGLSDIATGFINASRTKNTYKFNSASAQLTADFNSQMAQLQGDYNARIAQLQGRMIRLSADIEIKNIRDKALSLYSEQRAAYAKAGVKMEGSPAAVMVDSLLEAELDAIFADISTTYNVGMTEVQASLYKTEAQTQANIYNIEAQSQTNINKMYAASAKYDAIQNALKSVLNMGVKTYQRG